MAYIPIAEARGFTPRLIKPLRPEAEAIKAAAAAGQSLQGYILHAVRERMEREKGG